MRTDAKAKLPSKKAHFVHQQSLFREGVQTNRLRGAVDRDQLVPWILSPRACTVEIRGDWFWIGAYPDITDWAKGSTDYYASKEGAAVDARFNATNKCHANLWVGYWIAAPTVN